jgi:hypothetical protein
LMRAKLNACILSVCSYWAKLSPCIYLNA